MFDTSKTYSITVWDMSVAVKDVEADDYIRNDDGSIKLFNIPNYYELDKGGYYDA